MDFSLTEEQELLLASIRELITTNFPEEYFRTCDQNGTYPREFMRALADNGISMLGVPEEFGGIPADYVTQMLALMGNDSNLLIVFYVQIMPDDFVMQLHRF